MDLSFSDLNYNSVVIDTVAMLPSIETLPGFEARATLTVNSATVFKEDVDMVPAIVDDTLSYIPRGGDNPILHHRSLRKGQISELLSVNPTIKVNI